MKWFLLPLIVLAFNSTAQTRWFVSAGANTATQFTAEPNLNTGIPGLISAGTSNSDNKFGKYLRLSLTMEKRVYGPYYWLTGFKINQAGYTYKISPFSSSLKNTYLSIPLLVRANLFNANVVYLDVGVMENVLLSANLKESYMQSSDQKNVARYLSRLSTCFYFELGFNFRRFGISAFLQSNAFGTSKDFSGHWNLQHNNSYFLYYFQSFYYETKGINISYRIR